MQAGGVEQVGDMSSPDSTAPSPTRVIEIKPTKGWRFLDLKELWAYRELLYFLTWRDVKVRYKQTVFGAAWAILQPFLLMVVFTVVFGNMANVPSHGVPYPVFAFAALVPWTLFSQSLGAAANSLVGNTNLITKVYFPRIIVPVAAAGSLVLDFLIAMVILFAMLIYYGISPSLAVFWFLPLTLLTLVASLAGGLWLAALNVRYRDIRYAVPFLIQLLLFASPIAYSASDIEGAWRIFYALNPMTGIAEGFRWALLGIDAQVDALVTVSVGTVVVILLLGAMFFRRMEREFADVV